MVWQTLGAKYEEKERNKKKIGREKRIGGGGEKAVPLNIPLEAKLSSYSLCKLLLSNSIRCNPFLINVCVV